MPKSLGVTRFRTFARDALRSAALVSMAIAGASLHAFDVRAEPAAMQGGFELDAEASQWFNDNENVATGRFHLRLARDCTGWHNDFSLELSMTDLTGTLQIGATGMQIERVDAREGAAQLAVQFAGDRPIQAGEPFSYGARWRRAASDGAGDGVLNWATAAGQEQRAIKLRAGELTPVRAWWAMVAALSGGSEAFHQDLTSFGLLVTTELSDMARQKAFYGVIDPAFATMPLPADPSGAYKGRNWTVNISLPDDDTYFDGVRIAVLQLFETGVPGYIMLKRPDTRLLLRPTSVSLLPAPNC